VNKRVTIFSLLTPISSAAYEAAARARNGRAKKKKRFDDMIVYPNEK
jgi:hypothetical protein